MLYALINGKLYENIETEDTENIHNCLECDLRSNREYDKNGDIPVLCKYLDLVPQCLNNELGTLRKCEDRAIITHEGDRILNLGEF